jgi:hypothetical protein
MKPPIWIVITVLLSASLACSINLPDVPRLKTGPTETLTINEAAPADGTVPTVILNMGAGRLDLSGGSESLLSGEIQYNVAEWKPSVTNAAGLVTVTQGDSGDNVGIPESGAQVVNEWILQLGNAPMKVTVNAGAYDGVLDLSGVPLQSLSINDGASKAEVRFDSLNPEVMESLTYKTGASTVKLTGLANANFETLDFAGGAGDYMLDFSGVLQRDATVKVVSGVSNVRIVVPAGMTANVDVSGAVSNVNTEGTWTVNDKHYEVTGSGPTLTITVEMGVGNLTLVSEGGE